MSCHGIDGCFRSDEVNIGYRPYLRWSPDSTASDYLDGGDAVELRCHGPRGFAGVTVIASRTVAPGKSGWIDESALVR
jgi:hypothetical protein